MDLHSHGRAEKIKRAKWSNVYVATDFFKST
jgi:hypothetical protein